MFFTAQAYFAGGCFWCITPVFYTLPGVAAVTSGYSGGSEVSPVYEQVKHQLTGHRETVCIDYDPVVCTYEQLLTCFLDAIDPFDDGGQFIDRGHSYTTAIYYQSNAECSSARQALLALSEAAGKAPAVSVEPFSGFWPAEEEHQDYYKKNPEAFAREMVSSGRVPVSGKDADRALFWTVNEQTVLQHTPVFDLLTQAETAANGSTGTYVALSAPDWIVAVPVSGDDFILVRQFRHGLEGLTCEFPGGIGEPGESVLETAARELREETGFIAGRLTLLGSVNPNPALFKNRVHFVLAEELQDIAAAAPDPDEFLNVVRRPIFAVLEAFGTGEYLHAFMGTALTFWLRHRGLRL